jgi:hypothetical protein
MPARNSEDLSIWIKYRFRPSSNFTTIQRVERVMTFCVEILGQCQHMYVDVQHRPISISQAGQSIQADTYSGSAMALDESNTVYQTPDSVTWPCDGPWNSPVACFAV